MKFKWPWRNRFKRYKLVADRYRTEEAFSIDGVKYYQFTDPFEMPTGRSLGAFAYYEEIRQRCDREYLLAHTKAVETILSRNPINLQTLAQLNINLKERLELIMPLPDQVFKLASVYFFDETERLDTYDFEYANKKIARWKQNPETLNFFLTGPVKTLMPSLSTVSENSQLFMEVAK
jgi:hypothetical protein